MHLAFTPVSGSSTRFSRGKVSLIFEHAWAELSERSLTEKIPEGCWAVKHGSENHIRAAVEVVDPNPPFEQQEETVSAALDEVMFLLPLAELVAGQKP